MASGRGLSSCVAVASAVLFAAACSASPGPTPTPDPTPEPDPATPVYLALGDSWADGSFDQAQGGYVNRLHRELSADQAELELRNLARGGATTASLLANQLPQAEQLLADPSLRVDPITVTVGGNDVFLPILSGCAGGVTAACLDRVDEEFGQVERNLTTILRTLRSAADEEARIVVTAYDNPVPHCFLSSEADLAASALEGDPDLDEGLNDITRSVAANFDVAVAETFGTLDAGDWVGGFDCLHPNDSGHDRVKDAFVVALDG